MHEFGVLTTFLSGIGFGGVLVFLIKHFLEQKSKLKEIWLLDYKAACDGLLDAYREVALTNSTEALNKYAYWELKLQLYASDVVLSKLEEMKSSPPSTSQRDLAQKSLLKEMRKDLGLT
ncbi:hypothetical protein JX580_05440 [Thiomicrospira microaerophila]|uniref:hypothetical protein n=1 Tax=Thiomicrospira microaerophila TaxID=406020 RepID=UPI00200E4396|nr:hypothetical protein [Thiomicrospira microaerophila]UQB43313.1 hypothetical protein JX580_05440 [Thiomicrospira microaerophila]